MEREERTRFVMMTLGIYVYGALALGCQFVMALSAGNKPSALLTIAAAGMAYLAQVFGSGGMMKANGGCAAVCLLLSIIGFGLLF